ncbi:MAG TPA: nitrilase family protein [Lacibacter sp.]|nr:nitrilase family protein [Lacibacter sp.]HMO90482.1 nitrilase family protein [Lacibacter sp.]HMP86805.1 nitrilase family protein [Lacibacter sp.]
MSDLRVTLVQTRLEWEDPAANQALLQEKIRRAGPTQVVVLPEMCTTGFSMRPDVLAEPMDGPSVQWLRNLAAEQRVIVTGSFMIREEDRFFNRLLWMLPNGQYGQYDKRHLFAHAGEHRHYTPGHKRLIASVNGWRLHLQICYDLRFPVWARQTPGEEPEYDVLVYVANWPERRVQAWRSLLIARAIENQCYAIGVNRVGNDGNGVYHSGNSLVVDPLGEVLYEKEHEEDLHTVSLSRERLQSVRSQLPFLKDGDGFSIVP